MGRAIGPVLAIWLLLWGTAGAEVSPLWGRLADGSATGNPIRGAYFFAGQARDGRSFYGRDCAENLSLYTITPGDGRHLRWSQSVENRRFALTAMVEAGVNTVFMSSWGETGTDWWCRWAPMQTAPEAHDELFTVAAEFPVRIIPSIESHVDWELRAEFPGAPVSPSPGLVRQVVDLVERYVTNPEDPDWADQWARVYDREGNARYGINLLHVASNQSGVTHEEFAQGFTRVADEVERRTGVRVGFLLDALPDGTFAPGLLRPSPEETGALLYEEVGVLAINPYLPEIWLGSSDEGILASWKLTFAEGWLGTGIPCMQDVTPGYDAGIVFPGSPTYGNNTAWRESTRERVENQRADGICFNAWNGYTEGYAGVPTEEYGDVNADWARELFRLYGAGQVDGWVVR